MWKIVGLLCPGLMLCFLCKVRVDSAPPLVGKVIDKNGPVAKAEIRWQGERTSVSSDSKGGFCIHQASRKSPLLTALKKGYEIGSVPGKSNPLEIVLSALPQVDNPKYRWIDPTPSKTKAHNCGNCHAKIFAEWQSSSHAQSVKNRRFQNLFAGTDWNGQPHPHWNVLKENPLGSGVCANCHAPTFEDPNLAFDLRKVTGVAAHGIHCDYCHKVIDAPEDNGGLRFGKDGLFLLRPKQDHQISFGPLKDAVRKGEAFGYSPIYQDSRYCASCHEGVIFGVHVYGTYSEWQKSRARQKGQHCQDCHMKPTGLMTNIAPGKGGIERDPRTLGSHTFPGGTKEMLRDCLSIQSKLERKGNQVILKVEIATHNVGHRVPTGFIDRNLILVVKGLDDQGNEIPSLAGNKLPSAAGKYLAGKPGQLFAKLLIDPAGNSPIPFWIPHGEVRDTRLYPDKKSRHRFAFSQSLRKIQVKLIYRRFWESVRRLNQWPQDEIVIYNHEIDSRGNK